MSVTLDDDQAMSQCLSQCDNTLAMLVEIRESSNSVAEKETFNLYLDGFPPWNVWNIQRETKRLSIGRPCNDKVNHFRYSLPIKSVDFILVLEEERSDPQYSCGILAPTKRRQLWLSARCTHDTAITENPCAQSCMRLYRCSVFHSFRNFS